VLCIERFLRPAVKAVTVVGDSAQYCR